MLQSSQIHLQAPNHCQMGCGAILKQMTWRRGWVERLAHVPGLARSRQHLSSAKPPRRTGIANERLSGEGTGSSQALSPAAGLSKPNQIPIVNSSRTFPPQTMSHCCLAKLIHSHPRSFFSPPAFLSKSHFKPEDAASASWVSWKITFPPLVFPSLPL